jgi:hypothetical protein
MAISTVSFESFNEQYENKKFYKVDRLDQVDKYLLAEMHGGKKCSPTNGDFISFLASRYSVIIFIEGSEHMKEILDESVIQTIMKLKGIASEARHKMRFFGWDTQNEYHTRIFMLYGQLTLAYLQHDVSRRFFSGVVAQDENGEKDDLAKVLTNLLSCLSQLEQNLPYVKENSANIQTLHHQMNSETTAAFPMRTKCMVSSLKQAQTIPGVDLAKTKMVWVCGLMHLTEMDTRPEANLDSLREELQNHKAVTMTPKEIHATEEPSLDEQLEGVKHGKLIVNHQSVAQDPEILVEAWERQIDFMKRLQPIYLNLLDLKNRLAEKT